MKGLSDATKTRLSDLVDSFFDRMTLKLLGEVPSLKGKKSIVFTSRPDYTLGHLFLKNLNTTTLNLHEEEGLKHLLSTAEEYINSNRSKTKAELIGKIDAYVREKSLKKEDPSTVDIKNHLRESFKKAQNHFKLVAEAETTKASNMGSVFKIAKVAASQGVSDPNVYFVVIRDGKTCQHCIKAHLMPDGITPRVYKLSQVKMTYLSKEEKGNSVSVAGQHCMCRCRLAFLAEGFGFKDGQAAFIALGHDESKKQKE